MTGKEQAMLELTQQPEPAPEATSLEPPRLHETRGDLP